MRMLKGQLRETRYDWPSEEINNKKTGENENSQNASNITNQSDKNIYSLHKTEPDTKHDKEYDSNELQEVSSVIMENDSVHYINGECGITFQEF